MKKSSLTSEQVSRIIKGTAQVLCISVLQQF